MPHEITCLNGRFLRADKALLPVADRGFRFGDGVFETIRVTHGVPYQWETHMARLAAGLASLRIPAPAMDWAPSVKKLLKKNRLTEGFLRLSISRGVGSQGYLPSPHIAPNWAIEALPPRPMPERPYSLFLSTHARVPRAALPTNQKLAQGVGSTLALMEAADHGCEEALQLTPTGLIASAAAANLFWIKNRTIFTPSLATGCLDGTTRAALMRFSPLPIHEIDADMASLDGAQAMFLTSSRLGIWPVARIQNTDYFFDAAHPIIAELQQYWLNDQSSYITEKSVDWKNYP